MPDSLPRALTVAVGHELEPDEHILWCGQPHPISFSLHFADRFVLGIFAIVFGCALAWDGSQPVRGLGWLEQPWGSAVLPLVGIAVLLSPFWLASRTAYVVSERRALIVTRRLIGSTVQSYSGDLPTIDTDILGRESIVFARIPFRAKGGRMVFRDVGFFGLHDASVVARLLPHTRAVRRDDSYTLTSNERCN